MAGTAGERAPRLRRAVASQCSTPLLRSGTVARFGETSQFRPKGRPHSRLVADSNSGPRIAIVAGRCLCWPVPLPSRGLRRWFPVRVSYWGWPAGGTPDRTLELCGLLLVAILLSAYKPRRGSVGEGDIMQPSFVAEFAALVMIGLPLALAVSAASGIAHGLAQAPRRRRILDSSIHVATALMAMESAGASSGLSAGFPGRSPGPGMCCPLPLPRPRTASCAARSSASSCLSSAAGAPRPTGRPCRPRVAGLRARRDHRRCDCRSSCARTMGTAAGDCRPALLRVPRLLCSLDRIEEEHRRREVIDSLVQGMAVVNSSGEVTFWSDVLERMVGRVRGQAIGRSFTEAVPALGQDRSAAGGRRGAGVRLAANHLAIDRHASGPPPASSTSA